MPRVVGLPREFFQRPPAWSLFLANLGLLADLVSHVLPGPRLPLARASRRFVRPSRPRFDPPPPRPPPRRDTTPRTRGVVAIRLRGRRATSRPSDISHRAGRARSIVADEDYGSSSSASARARRWTMTRLPSLVAPLAFALALCALATAPSARAVIETKSNTIDHVADTGLGYVPKFNVKSDSGIKHVVGSTTVCEASSTGLAVTGMSRSAGRWRRAGSPTRSVPDSFAPRLWGGVSRGSVQAVTHSSSARAR